MNTVLSGEARTVVGFAQLGFPEVPLVGRYTYARAHPPLKQHVHRNAFEACVLQHGTQAYTVGESRFDLSAGDMIITKPGDIHGTDTEPENRGRLYWVQFIRPAPGHRFLDLSVAETRQLFERFSGLSTCLYHQCAALVPTFEQVLAAAADAPTLLPKAHIRNALVRLVLELAELTSHTAQTQCSSDIRRALGHLEAHCACHVSVASLARVAGISESHFKAKFRREVGMTPMEYLLWYRTEQAKRLLRNTDRPVTSIAIDLGFATSQHFATVFKRLTDCTPRAFRATCLTQPKTLQPPAAGIGPRFHPVAVQAP